MGQNRVPIVKVFFLAVLSTACCDKSKFKENDIMRKSIVFDENTPDVFYCPAQKPSTINKLIVKARPLHKLCEFEGNLIPPSYKSDCYMNIDETVYACKEKYRIMKRFTKEDTKTLM